MHVWKVVFVTVAFAACFADANAQTEVHDWQSWGAVTDTLVPPPNGGRINLGSPFVVAGSESVSLNGRPLQRDAYEINYQRGLMLLRGTFPPGSSLIVSYTRLPVLLSSVYALRDPQLSDDSDQPTPVIVPDEKRDAPLFNPTGDLTFGGVKSISLAVGTNKSTSLDQTLRVTVEGQLTNSIKVRALLSDDNLPVQPEGNTQELEYLDKVFVEFSGPRAKATLGDIAFQNDFSSFTSFRRELEGVSGEVDVLNTKVSAAGGRSKGTFRTVQFRGIDQLQGPYNLLGETQTVNEVIIAGTEVVYLDGQPMQRGRDRDFTIDYDRGTITFTPRRAITADTEIAVDFEVTQNRFDRTSSFGTVDSRLLPLGFQFQTMVARVRDDDGRPRATSVDEGDRLVIAEAGDDPTKAIASGAEFVGPGEGDYTLVPGDSVLGIPDLFVFEDSTGTYRLTFVQVGPGNGDYILDRITATGKPVYEFVGDRLGNFVVGKRLPLPEAHDVVTTRLVRQGKGRLEFDLQYNVSDFDANTLSVIDDDDNIGDAGAFRMALRNIPIGLGSVEFAGNVTTLEESFHSLDRARSWFFYRDWNLEGVPLEGREIIGQGTASFLRGEGLRLDYDYGELQRDDFDGVRQEARFFARAAPDRLINARAFATDMTGELDVRTRDHVTVAAKFGMFGLVPEALYGAEEFLVASPVQPDSGIAYDRVVVGIGKRQPRNFGYKFEWEQRNTREVVDTTDAFTGTRRDRSFRASANARARFIQGALTYTHRIQENLIFADRTTSDVARLNGVLRFKSLGFRSNFDYEISQNQFRRQEKQIVFVGEGQGDFNELGEPVGKGLGAFTVVFLPTLDTFPTTSVNFTVFTALKSVKNGTPFRGGGPIEWLRANVAFEQSLTIREQTRADDAYKVYLFFPSVLQRDDATIAGNVSIRQDWLLLGGYPNWNLNFRIQRDDDEDNSFDPLKENRLFEQLFVRLDRSFSRLITANVQGTRESRRRDGKGLQTGTGSTYDVDGVKAALGVGFRLGGGSTVDVEVEARRQVDADSEAEETALALRPRFVWRIARPFSLFGSYELTRFDEQSPNGVRPFFFTSTGNSQRWSLTPNLRLSKVINLSATYQGRAETTFSGARIVEHDFRIETRAFF